MEKMVPKIRFNGFVNEWINMTIKEVAKITTGASNTQDQTDKGEYPFFIRSEEIMHSNKYLYDDEAVITVGDGQIGKIFHYINGKYDLHQRCYKIYNFDGVDGKFFYYLFSTKFYKRAMSMSAKGTVDSVRMEMIADMIIQYSGNNKEQKSIANYFVTIDRIIELSETKLKKLKELKKTMLYKMFPQNGSKVPEIRLKGFSGEWDYKQISNIANRLDNLRIPVTEKERMLGETPYYGANGIQDFVTGYTHDGVNILIAEDGANDINDYPIRITFGKIWVNNHAHVIKVKENYDSLCVYFALKNVNYYDILMGSSRYKLTAFNLENIVIRLPRDINEQQAIGDYFNKFDNMINKYNEKITKLKELKKTLLNKMFV